ncbi:MAG TPA: hypothetical protein DCS09_01245 [Porphyromonadaceae bacterium]|nr:hypothetical protein [Porphyromonadaceae bacterium]
MERFPGFMSRLSTVKELFAFFWQNRLWWLIPFVVVLLVIGLLLVFAQTSPIAPLLYTAF